MSDLLKAGAALVVGLLALSFVGGSKAKQGPERREPKQNKPVHTMPVGEKQTIEQGPVPNTAVVETEHMRPGGGTMISRMGISANTSPSSSSTSGAGGTGTTDLRTGLKTGFIGEVR